MCSENIYTSVCVPIKSIKFSHFQNQMVQGVACVAPNDGDLHIPWGWTRLIYVHISLGKIDLLSHVH